MIGGRLQKYHSDVEKKSKDRVIKNVYGRGKEVKGRIVGGAQGSTFIRGRPVGAEPGSGIVFGASVHSRIRIIYYTGERKYP